MSNRWFTELVSSLESALVWFVLALGYTAFVIGAMHNYPNGEDLWLSAAARDVGIGQSILNLLSTYDGRYSTNILHALNPLSFGYLEGYKWLPILAIALLLVGTYLTISVFLTFSDKIAQLKLTLILVLAFLATIPLLSTSLYWAGGCFVYLYPLIFLLLYLGVANRYFINLPYKDNFGLFVFTAFLLVFSIGFNEMFLVMHACMILGMVVYVFYNRSKLHQLLPLVMLSASGILFLVVAPGPGGRLSEVSEPLEVGLLLFSAGCTFQTIADLWLNPVYLVLFFYVALVFLTNSRGNTYKFSTKHFVLAITVTLLISLGMVGLYHVAKRTYDYPIRIFAPITGLFTVVLFIGLPSWLRQLRPSASFLSFIPLARLSLLVLVLVQFLWGHNNVAALLSDYQSGKMCAFKAQMDQRTVQLKACAASDANYKVCRLDVLPTDNYPKSIYPYPDSEENQNSSVWNRDLEAYFKVDRVVTFSDTTLRYNPINLEP